MSWGVTRAPFRCAWTCVGKEGKGGEGEGKQEHGRQGAPCRIGSPPGACRYAAPRLLPLLLPSLPRLAWTRPSTPGLLPFALCRIGAGPRPTAEEEADTQAGTHTKGDEAPCRSTVTIHTFYSLRLSSLHRTQLHAVYCAVLCRVSRVLSCRHKAHACRLQSSRTKPPPPHTHTNAAHHHTAPDEAVHRRTHQ